VELLIQDLRCALRLYRRNLGATVIAVLTLAVGIGANVALFSVVNAVLIRSLPFREPRRLVYVYETNPYVPKFPASYLDYNDWKEQTKTFEEMAGYSFRDHDKMALTLAHGGEPLQITGTLISHNLFSLLGIQPQYGRDFLPEDEQPGRDHVVILGYRLWERQFGSDPAIVGTSIEMDGNPFNVIGVMSQRGQFPAEADLWLPLSLLGNSDFTNRARRSVWVLGRLKPTVDERMAFAEMTSIARRLQETYPEADKNVGVVQLSLLDYYTGGIRPVLLVLLGAASLVMLIACANVANLLLARGVNRKQEIAIRAAHGATRIRIFRQLLSESVLLAVIGTAGGLAAAFAGTVLLKHWASGISSIPRLTEANIDPVVLAYAVGVAALTALLFGTLPAVQAARTDLNETLKQGGRGALSGSIQGRLRNLLMVSEVAIAVTVLIGTGLLVKSLTNLIGVNPGFRTDNLLTVQLSISSRKYSEYIRIKAFYQQLLDNVKRLPAVEGAATINVLHIVPSLGLMHFGVEGAPAQQLAQYPIAQIRSVSPGYFELMNIPIKGGRSFQDRDVAETAQPGCIINETLARTYFPSQDPTGKRILMVEAPSLYGVPIIGVAADVKDIGLDKAAEPEIYSVGFSYDEVLLVHTTGNPHSVTGAIRRGVQAIDPYQPIGQVRTMQEVVDESLSRRKLLANLMAMFSALALILSATGIYGVMSYAVVQRTSEIGLRMALGAGRREITHLLLRQGMAPVLVGLTLGLLGAWSFRKIVSGMLYGTSSTDVVTYLAVATLIVLTAAAAILVPTRRASRIDPQTALRES
jgi:predicted permease